MRSHLRKVKITFILAITLTMSAIFVAQHQFSLARSSQLDPMLVATEKLFAYMENQHLESPSQVLGISTDASQSARSIQVLYYHGISETETKSSVSFANFKDQMYKLKENGFETVTSQQLEDFILHGKPLPPRSFLLTFDDGRKDSFYPVDPVLKALNYHAVMFLIAHEVQDRNSYYLTNDEVKTMLATGRWEIQAHTFDLHHDAEITKVGDKGHALTNKLWLSDERRLESSEEYKTRIYDDLFSSKQDLEKRFGVPIRDFAYPFGDYGQGETNFGQAKEILASLVKKLYRFAFYQPWEESAPKNIPHIDTKMIKRIGVEPSWTGIDLLKLMLHNEDKYLPYNEDFSDPNAWIANWGEGGIENKALRLKAGINTTGALVLLVGSEGWKDFYASASATLASSTESISILGRANEGDYCECVFTNEGIYYREKQQGKAKMVAEMLAQMEEKFSSRLDIVMKMRGGKVTCALADGSLTLSSLVTSELKQANQIGFSIWGRKRGKSSAEINYVFITKTDD